MQKHRDNNVRTLLQQFRPKAIKLGIGSENGKEGSSAKDTEEKLASRLPNGEGGVVGVGHRAAATSERTIGSAEQVRG